MRIDVRQEGGAVVLAVSGRMDATTVDGFEAACRDRIAPENPRIVVDFAKLEYVSSAGLRGILTMEKESRAAGSRIVFCGMQDMVADMFDLSGFNSILQVCPTLEQALAG